MPVQIDRMDAVVELTGSRRESVAPTTTPATAQPPASPPPAGRESPLQTLADCFDQFLRNNGI